MKQIPFNILSHTPSLNYPQNSNTKNRGERERRWRERGGMGAQRKNTPRASPKKKSTTLQYLFDLDSTPVKNTKQSSHDFETEELLSLISCCTYIFSFKDPAESPSQQELKRHKLNQLLSILRSSKNPFGDQVLSPLFAMFSENLFRPLPPPSTASATSEFLEDEELSLALNPGWTHLQIVYEILHKLVLNSEPKSLSSYIDLPFLHNLLSLFQTEDRRERESLKNLYHRIYSKFTFHRAYMRKSMNDVFLHFVFETERGCGIGELLEIWGSIINGFTVPLKEEHKMFLMRVLVPLHKPKGMPLYHRQLAYCVSQFVQKEPMLGEVVLKGILRSWPLTNCQKELLLIGEVEELVEYTDDGEVGKLAVLICSQIGKCLNSRNSQVAERALYVWNNEQFFRMASKAMEQVLPAIAEAIEKNIKWHWSKSVRQLTMDVKKMLEEMEPAFYSKCLQELNLRESMAAEEHKKREERWERLEMAAVSNQIHTPPNCICVSH